MTDIEKLRDALVLIKETCKKYQCYNCPIYEIPCFSEYPCEWPIEKIGVEHDET